MAEYFKCRCETLYESYQVVLEIMLGSHDVFSYVN